MDLATVIVPELCDVADRASIGRVLKRYRPETLFHAAAYKHVPLVESNPVAGLRTNVMGPLNTVLAAGERGVGRFIPVSTANIRREQCRARVCSYMYISVE